MARGQDMDHADAQRNARRRSALVIGGGLAGIAAACTLAERGLRVVLLEKRPYLGGRVYSFLHKEMGLEIDNGQHIFLRCCTHYIRLLEKLGVYHRTRVQRRLSVPVVGADGSRSVLYRVPLPAPWHMTPSLALYQHLTIGEKASIAKIISAMRTLKAVQRAALDSVSFYDWLVRQGQTEWAIMNFWDVIVLPTMNDDCRRVSAGQAIMVFQEGFIGRGDAADVGVSTVGLSSLLYREATEHIASHGGQVLLGRSVCGLEGTREGIRSATTFSGERFEADTYVMATPPRELLTSLPDGLRQDPFFQRASRLRTSPIVNMHLWLDRTVTDQPMATYLNSHIQWVFSKPPVRDGREKTPGSQGQHLVISISGAHRYIDLPKQRLFAILWEDLRERLPKARGAQVQGFAIMRERDATFTPEPGSGQWRLPQLTPVPNLFLAGAWTETGWPGTMEGAVRSGELAAEAVTALG